jgi:hypothetical protein
MKRSVSILFKLGLLCIALLMGWLAGEWLAREEKNGMFVQWELIGTPPGKATKILAAETTEVYVTTSTEKIYQCGYHTTECRETSKPIQLIERPCGEVFYQPPYMPDEVVASTEATDCRMFRTQTNYVIRKDGSVWAWGPRQLIFWGSLVYPLCGAVLGLILGSAFLVIMRRAVNKARALQHSDEV